MFTTVRDVSPAWAVEMLNKLVNSFKDFCGILSEESLRRNFILIYELLDEMIDFGYPQTTSAECLKLCVHSDAVSVDNSIISKLPKLSILPSNHQSRTVPSTAVTRPIGMSSSSALATSASSLSQLSVFSNNSVSRRNEIFVDILERVNVLINKSGDLVNMDIDGLIQMKSYLSSSSEIKVSLNEDLSIATDDISERHGQLSSSHQLDDVTFHECAIPNILEFYRTRIFSIVPPEGEFVLMNYRLCNNQSIHLPFRIYPQILFNEKNKIELIISIKADIPQTNYGTNMVIFCSVPPTTRSVSAEVLNSVGSGDYSPTDQRIVWQIKKLTGGQECTLRARVSLSPSSNDSVGNLGPLSMTFEIPMFNLSNLQVRYLRINESSTNTPFRWVRYVTQSQSYVHRLL